MSQIDLNAAQPPESRSSVTILGVRLDAVTKVQALRRIEQSLTAKRRCLVFTPNPEMLVRAARDRSFKELLNRSDLSVPDATGDVWAANFLSLPVTRRRFLRPLQIMAQWTRTLAAMLSPSQRAISPLPERVTGTDLAYSLAGLAAERGYRLFLLGARPGVAAQAARRLSANFPTLQIAGISAASPELTEEIFSQIQESRADILYVAYGVPKQEAWLAGNLELSKVLVGIGIGGAFDFWAGHKKRAPERMRSVGLEWLFRLVQEPKRFKRIWTAVVVFPILILKAKLRS